MTYEEKIAHREKLLDFLEPLMDNVVEVLKVEDLRISEEEGDEETLEFIAMSSEKTKTISYYAMLTVFTLELMRRKGWDRQADRTGLMIALMVGRRMEEEVDLLTLPTSATRH